MEGSRDITRAEKVVVARAVAAIFALLLSWRPGLVPHSPPASYITGRVLSSTMLWKGTWGVCHLKRSGNL